MATYISVNKHIIAGNLRHGRNDPPIRVSRGKSGKPKYGYTVKILGSSELVYNSQEPILKCGARLVLVTDADVVIDSG